MIHSSHFQLWEKLKRFEIDNPYSSLTFSDRLARENGWSLEFSIRSIGEYKKFIFLLCTVDHPLTPSDEIDQVWHLHLLYTQSYWNEMCETILGRSIHHGPTKGGKKEQDKFTDYYSKTLEAYQDIFDEIPPNDIWPASEIRFKRINFQRVNLDENWIIKKPNLFIK